MCWWIFSIDFCPWLVTFFYCMRSNWKKIVFILELSADYSVVHPVILSKSDDQLPSLFVLIVTKAMNMFKEFLQREINASLMTLERVLNRITREKQVKNHSIKGLSGSGYLLHNLYRCIRHKFPKELDKHSHVCKNYVIYTSRVLTREVEAILMQSNKKV